MNQNTFLVRMRDSSSDVIHSELALEEKIIGIGWRYVPLKEMKCLSDLKENLRTHYPPDSERAIGQTAGIIWRFYHRINVGDRVVLPVDDAFHVGEITSEPYYSETAAKSTNSSWRRDVIWGEKRIPRSHASNDLQKGLKARHTCVKITHLDHDITKAMERESPISFKEDILKSSSGSIANALLTSINPDQFEKLVKNLASSSGARTRILPKNDKKKGDADIEAIYDLKIGNQDASIQVLYQVKQHKGESGDSGVKQLIERMDEESSMTQGCFVTTAETITDSARKLAEENNVIILVQEDLVEWILNAGISTLED